MPKIIDRSDLLDDECDPCVARIKDRGISIGKEMKTRLKKGNLDRDSMLNYELEMIKNTECVLRDHSRKKKITIKEADRLVSRLEDFLANVQPPPCVDIKGKVQACLIKCKDNSIACEPLVTAFSNCIDDMMYETTRKDDSKKKMKLSYTEKFEQLFV